MTQKPIQLVIVGASGRMGQLLCSIACQRYPEFDLIAAVAHTKSKSIGFESDISDDAPTITRTFGGKCDVVIDFSTPAGTANALQIALNADAALVVATTGLDDDLTLALKIASRRIPVMIASNTSPGMAVIAKLVEDTACKIDCAASQIQIVECHHAAKKDAPSGTALHLGEAVAAGLKLRADCGAEDGNNEIHIKPEQYHSLRGGSVVGEHTVRFLLDDEYIEIHHTAVDRKLFANGALKAAAWLYKQPAGLYQIADTV